MRELFRNTMSLTTEKPNALTTDRFAADVRNGLRQFHKQLPCKYIYDRHGAELFNRICELPEYYPTWSETLILQRYASQMAELMGPYATIIELGSGSAMKTRLLLDRLHSPAVYIPVDISAEQLTVTAQSLSADYPHIIVHPIEADFTQPFALPNFALPKLEPNTNHRTDGRHHRTIGQPIAGRRVIYFPGSTIGNFEPPQRSSLLSHLHRLAGPRGLLLIGIDLKKDPAILHTAYNDKLGITAAFNRNILHRINRELAGSFVPSQFDHYAFYQPEYGRIEMHLVSHGRQTVHIADDEYEFAAGESLFTESSYKYDPYEFADIAAEAGFSLQRMWLDDQRWFAVQLFQGRPSQ
ncbi:MAG: L-histidine N(alpha)-methyltransferase [Phycisphaerae bacterium]|nr:L-histidine N(alpha)-methyltransferase [Phycisphaerae bacterium]